MDAGHDQYHVRIDHHSAAPAALAAAQRAFLEKGSEDARRSAVRAWKQRAIVVVGSLLAVGLVVLGLVALSTGRATAHESCVADAEGMASKFSAAELDSELLGQHGSVEELCASYRS